jgi:hypothetical protein
MYEGYILLGAASSAASDTILSVGVAAEAVTEAARNQILIIMTIAG